MLKEDESLKCTKSIEDDELVMLTISNFFLQHLQLPLPVFVLKMAATEQSLLAVTCKLLLKIQIYRKKVQGPVFINKVSCYYTFFYFISCKTYG